MQSSYDLSDQKKFSDDVLFEIIKHLPPEDIVKMSLVSKRFENIANVVGKYKMKLYFPDDYQEILNNQARAARFSSRLTEEDGAQYPQVVTQLLDKANIKKIKWTKEFARVYETFLGKNSSFEYKKIFSFLRENDIERVKNFISEKSNLIESLFFNMKNRKGKTMSSLIVETGNQSLFDHLYTLVKAEYLKMDSPYLRQDAQRRTLLHWAVIFNQSIEPFLNLSSLLNDAGVSALDLLEIKKQVLHFAVRLGRLGIVKLIVEKEPALLNGQDPSGRTPLMIAALEGHQDIVCYFLECKDIQLSLQDNKKRSILDYAVSFGNVDVLRKLITSCPPLILEANKKNLISLAIKYGHLEIVKEIVKMFGDQGRLLLDTGSADGRTLLMLAVKNAHEDVVNFLLEQPGIDLSAQYNNPKESDKKGWTALHFAVFFRNIDIFESVFKKCDEALFKTHQQSLLLLADQCDHYEAFLCLIRKDAMIGLDDAAKKKLLLSTAKQGYFDVVKKLINTDSSLLNTKDEHNQTALHYAVESKNIEVISALLKHILRCDDFPENLVPIDCSQLDKMTGAAIKLLQFIVKEPKKEVLVPHSPNLFSNTQTLVDPQIKKTNSQAAKTLMNLIVHNHDATSCQNELAGFKDILDNNTELKTIYDELCKVKPDFILLDKMSLVT